MSLGPTLASHPGVDAAPTARRGIAARIAVLLIRAWQIAAPPLMRGHCRFSPSCSAYARESFERHGFARGLVLAARRLARCHPLGARGYDPVP